MTRSCGNGWTSDGPPSIAGATLYHLRHVLLPLRGADGLGRAQPRPSRGLAARGLSSLPPVPCGGAVPPAPDPIHRRFDAPGGAPPSGELTHDVAVRGRRACDV